MQITFIQTGGTIDKDYPRTAQGWAFEFGEPATRRILEKLDPSFDFEILTACQKDSQEITDEDRQQLAELIAAQPGSRFVVTHGTDTLIETATYLESRIDDKVVVLTGAMRPERFTNSDAPIHVGMAIAAARLLDRGVFIAMHGVVCPPSRLHRDPTTGQFRE